MKNYNLVALVSLLGSISAHAQQVAESPLLAPAVVTVSDANFLSVAEASKLFKNFGAKKVDDSTFMLVGTIANECKDKVEITGTDSMGKDGFAGGWKIEDKGNAQECVDAHTASCTPSTCKSLSELAPRFTIVDINVTGMTKDQLKSLADQKIGLFKYDYAQDMSAPEYVQADPLSGVAFVSPTHLAVLAEIAAEEKKEKMITDNEAALSDCLANGKDYEGAKDAVYKLRQLGKLTDLEAKKELLAIQDAEFEADIAKATTVALIDRKDLLAKYDGYATTRTKDADKIADARMEIARRIVSGTEKTEEDEAVGLVRADFIEANDILSKAGKSKGLTKAKSQAISAEITANNEKRAVTMAGKGEMSNSDMIAAQRQYVAIENKACSPQDKMQIQQQRRQSQMQQYGQQGYGQQGYGNQMGMGMNFQMNAGYNNPFANPYMQQQQQQRNNQYNSQACWGAYQAEQSITYLKQQSDQTKYQMLAQNNSVQNGQNPNMVGNFQQVRPNLYTTNPSQFQQNTGMWNNNQGYNSNVYNPNMAMNYNTYGQYDQYGNRRW